MTSRPNPIPLRPDYSAVRHRPSDAIVRAAIARGRSAFQPGANAGNIAHELWPRDQEVRAILTRTATAPATTTTSGWAAPLAVTAVSDLLSTMGPASASGALFKQATMLDFESAAYLNVPALSTVVGDAQFVAEGSPIPVRMPTATLAQLVPRKLA